MNQYPPTQPGYCPALGSELRLCADEMWSFVGNKKGQRWLWVEDAETGQVVVAFIFGQRTHATFRRVLAVLEAAGWSVEQ